VKCEREFCGGTLTAESERYEDGRWRSIVKCLSCGREPGPARAFEEAPKRRKRTSVHMGSAL
jgi:hypothetical protein